MGQTSDNEEKYRKYTYEMRTTLKKQNRECETSRSDDEAFAITHRGWSSIAVVGFDGSRTVCRIVSAPGRTTTADAGTGKAGCQNHLR